MPFLQQCLAVRQMQQNVGASRMNATVLAAATGSSWSPRSSVAPRRSLHVARSTLARPITHSHRMPLHLARTTVFSRSFLGVPSPLSGTIGVQPSPDGDGTIPVVLVSDAKEIWSQFDCIVDVREKSEVDEGMIPGAIHIPLAKILADPNQPAFESSRQVLVYCRAGIRSAKAAAAMQKAGINAVNLGGGYLAWQDQK